MSNTKFASMETPEPSLKLVWQNLLEFLKRIDVYKRLLRDNLLFV